MNTYAIVRLEDQEVVEPNLTKEEAEKRIIFYDTQEDPHEVQNQSQEMF